MEKFVIYLPEFKNSVDWASNAIKSSNIHGWNLQLYKGVNGYKNTLDDFNIRASKINKKCFKYMQRPGTVGCFLSHYLLWKKSVDENKKISIFEHDVVFLKPPPDSIVNADVIKYEGFKKSKPIPCGNWYEGARAYTITPTGAKKLIEWISINGAMPADWMLCDGIIKMYFDLENRVTFDEKEFSFTKDL